MQVNIVKKQVCVNISEVRTTIKNSKSQIS